MPEIQLPSWQLLLSTSCNRNHRCVWQVHCPLLELSWKETRWHFGQPQGATMATPAPVSGRGQREHCQHIGLCASLIWCKFDLILAIFSALTSVPARHLPLFNEWPLPSICVCFLWALLSSVCFFFILSVKPLCSIVLLPFSAILTNLILFVFHVPNTTVLLFTVKPFSDFVICLTSVCSSSSEGAMCLVEHTYNGGTPSWSV